MCIRDSPIADPDELDAFDRGSRVVVIDAKIMGRINRELIRWGRHCNQAVRALNTIAMFVRNKGGIDPQVAKEQLTKAADELELVQGSVEAVSYTHLDVYKRQGSSLCPAAACRARWSRPRTGAACR